MDPLFLSRSTFVGFDFFLLSFFIGFGSIQPPPPAHPPISARYHRCVPMEEGVFPHSPSPPLLDADQGVFLCFPPTCHQASIRSVISHDEGQASHRTQPASSHEREEEGREGVKQRLRIEATELDAPIFGFTTSAMIAPLP
ncbi:hypothetical protein IE53DRAFT_175119 [Violaceomyces palustris]|uniref:Uncharacterized protein n=1 Tax=Violaceomyces palustris TaxID=1673888 RepID=A0ACD0NSR6_9BASI|nr:hypothetical protein IE53DRAFT_175119 [Violaceomyces palustris]